MKGNIILRLFLVTTFIWVLFIASEILYETQNDTGRIDKTLHFLILNSCQNKNLSKICHLFIDFEANRYMKRYRVSYSNLIPNDEGLNYILTKNDLIKKDVDKIISEKINNSPQELKSPFFSSIYYHIGIDMYKNGFKVQSIPFLKKSIYTHSEISFMYVELADVYFDLGKTNDGVNVLEFCQQFQYPAKHCREYLEDYNQSGNKYEIGFYEDVIDDYQ